MSEAREPSGFEEVRRLFRQACGLPPAQRRAFLVRECGTRREVRHEVLELLRHLDRAPAFLRQGEE